MPMMAVLSSEDLTAPVGEDRVREDPGLPAGAPPWSAGPLVGFDLETTGVDPVTARIVTASLVFLPAGRPATARRTWLVDPGVPIPEEAAAIHGISTAHARACGAAAGVAVPEILEQVDRVWCSGIPMVVFNAPYDLTVLDAEAVRHDLPPLTARRGWRHAAILDPLVIDRRVDRYRRGKRTLQASAEHYGVSAFTAHSSDADAAAACLVARAIGERFRWVGRVEPPALRCAQVSWYRQWARRLQRYLATTDRRGDLVDDAWPLRELGAAPRESRSAMGDPGAPTGSAGVAPW
jgi:DNA polymerase-3 subunit epsilon